eukprot:scaffold27751_cov71-Phaeocystis_antarctica.AAC.2
MQRRRTNATGEKLPYALQSIFMRMASSGRSSGAMGSSCGQREAVCAPPWAATQQSRRARSCA